MLTDNGFQESYLLTDPQLEALLHSESDRVEWKQSLSDPDRIREAICAFANDLPGHGSAGVVFVGINDDGSCAGQHIDDQLLLRLSQMRDDGLITPFPSMTVQKRTLAGCEVAVVIVEPSQSLPVRFRGRVCIRVGPRRAVATPEEERRLLEKQRGFDLPFDAREELSASLTDLDANYIRDEYLPAAIAPDVLAENRRSLNEQLSSIHFLGRSAAPTHVGLLVAAIDPLAWLPGNGVMHRNYDGTNAPVRVYWFDDRIEIHSPGGPFGRVNRDNFGQPYANDYRNPHPAEAMKNLGFVQRFGVGIAIARRELEKNGNPGVEFVVEPSAVLAVVRRVP